MEEAQEMIWEDVDTHIEGVGRVEGFIKALRTYWNKGLIFGFRTKRLVIERDPYYVAITTTTSGGNAIVFNSAAAEKLPLDGFYLQRPGGGALTYVFKNEREPFADLDEALSALKRIVQRAVRESKES